MSEKSLFTLPCIATRDVVVFPGMRLTFDVSRPRSLNAILEAFASEEYNRLVYLVMQKDSSVEDPDRSDLCDVGTVCRIIQAVELPRSANMSEGITRITVEGSLRARTDELYKDRTDGTAPLSADVSEYSDKDEAPVDLRSLEVVKKAFKEYCDMIPKQNISDTLKLTVRHAANGSLLCKVITENIMFPSENRQELLEDRSLKSRLVKITRFLEEETFLMRAEEELHTKTHEHIMQEQREYFLREEMRVIREELGDEEDPADESFAYLEKISKTPMPQEAIEKLVEEANRLGKMPYGSQEAAVIRSYLDTVLELPWDKETVDRNDISKVSAQLDKDHYGMKKVKERILELIAVRSLIPDVKGQIICLVGPPGVGKTSIGKSIAKALGRKYVRVSLGGVRDESDIRGHRKTYIGSMPGRIIAAVKQTGTKNPLILLDEIDKMANDFRGDPSSAMLEVLDSEQNKEFRDHYIEVPFDLSKVLFVTTANTLDTISPPLLDRMDVIELPSYTREEKFEIARRHLIPKQLKANGMNGRMLRFTDAGIYELIDFYTREAGVRTLERLLASLCRKAAKEIVSKSASRITVTPETVEKYLGARKFTDDLKSDKPQVGEVNGLAWTAVGGTLMPLEVLSVDGKGALELTGSLGDVMKESAKIAVTYARSVAEKYGIEKDFNQKKDLHIHAPEGAVPKDGPSAGVTLATGIISELSGIPVRSDVAMTGEITLRGKVLPIGGLREKTMAAYKAGIRTVIIPAANKPDLEEVDEKVKAGLEFVYAETIEDVLETALLRPEKEAEVMAQPQQYSKPKTRIGARS